MRVSNDVAFFAAHRLPVNRRLQHSFSTISRSALLRVGSAIFKSAFVILALLGLCASVNAATFYTENFDVDNTANWVFNSSISGDGAADNAGNEANFFFDYSTVGIPSAPGSGGTTRGLKLEANIPGTGKLAGASASPLGLSLPSQYILKAYVWQNSLGPFPGGGSGSTQITNMTVGATGAASEFSGGVMTGVQGGVTGDGGSSVDWRAYSAAFPDGAGAVIATSHAGVYPTSSLNAADTYWSTNFPGLAPPAAQAGLYASQTGNVQNGATAFAWRLWEIRKTDSGITWTIDGIPVANVTPDLFPANFGNNIAFGQADINATSSTSTDARALLFGLIDNVSVEEIPEPASVLLCLVASVAFVSLRRRG